MKKLVFSLVAVALLAGVAAAQGNTQTPSTKAFTISSKVSEYGKILLAENSNTWFVANPDALTRHQGQQVKVKCRLALDSHNVRVLSVKTVDTQKYAANKGDSAFRR